MSNKKITIVLFNIGGPDKAESVERFLFNFFYDKAIINLPKIFRFFIAKLISRTRKNKSIAIYNHLGGGSPILKETKMQAKELEKALANKNYKVFISMRYWHPMSDEVIKEVGKFNPEKVILLPLYPQFSVTTSKSSIKNWFHTAKKNNFSKKTEVVCCYYMHQDFINAYTELLKETYALAKKNGKPRVLFSAHGLPESVIKSGDPYQWQIEQTAHAIINQFDEKDLDFVICYQSKVGPMKWIEPYTENEIIAASKQKIPIVIIPIAFVSEHSETLVELDIEYKELAEEYGNNNYYRVPTVRTHPKFIECLKNICLSKIDPKERQSNFRTCKSDLKKCYLQN